MSDSPTPAGSPARSTLKTLLLWTVLICVFAFVYARESEKTHPVERVGIAAPMGTTFVERFGNQLLAVLTMLLIGLLLKVLVDLMLWTLRRRWEAKYREARALEAARLENEGQLDEAARHWEELAQRAPRDSEPWADLTLREAWVALRQGRGSQAMDLLEPVLSHQDPRQRELAHALLALVMAVRGHLPRTESLLNGLQDEGVLRGVVGGLGSQVLLSRRGEYAEALALAVPPWDIADPLCRHHRQLWALLRAFALEHLPPTPERERDARRTLALLRGVRPGEFDYLIEQWPELRTWLAQRPAAGETPASPAATSEAPAEPGPQAFASASFGLGLPARYDPVRPAGEDPRRALLLLALLGGSAWLLSLSLQGTAFLGLRLALFGVLTVLSVVGIWMPWLLPGIRGRSIDRGAHEAMQEMRVEEGVRLFDQALTRLRGSALAHARRVTLLNLANALAKKGERSLARRIFHALAHQAPRGSSPRLRAMAMNHLAEAEALAGNSARANLLDGLAEPLWEGQRPTDWSTALLVDAVKAGDTDEVSDIAEELLAKPGVPEHYRRRMLLFQAFTHEQVEHPTPGQQEERARLQEQLRQQAVPGEFDYLTAEWPELRAFLEGLGKTRAAA